MQVPGPLTPQRRIFGPSALPNSSRATGGTGRQHTRAPANDSARGAEHDVAVGASNRPPRQGVCVTPTASVHRAVPLWRRKTTASPGELAPESPWATHWTVGNRPTYQASGGLSRFGSPRPQSKTPQTHLYLLRSCPALTSEAKPWRYPCYYCCPPLACPARSRRSLGRSAVSSFFLPVSPHSCDASSPVPTRLPSHSSRSRSRP